jgi:hypothetical protein
MKRRAIIALAASAVALLLVVLYFGASSPKAQAQVPLDPHYKCYSITGPAVNVPVSVKTQFGTEQAVMVGMPSLLCLPAGKNGPEPPAGWPDLKCYNITGQDAKRLVNLETQFGLEREVWVRQAHELCVPASRTASEPPTTPNYECYSITGTAPSVPPVVLKTAWGEETNVVVGQPARLCSPAGVNSLDIPGVPHLKCYTIDKDPPVKTVDLKTRFPIEEGVVVGRATRLCVPAIKQLLLVGGTADLPALAGASAEGAGAPAQGSGWSAGAYGALAAGLAAAAVALSAGAWYARRRLLR